MSYTVLYADEEKAGPASVPAAESVVVGSKKEEEFRNYKNSKRQAVSLTSMRTTLRIPRNDQPSQSHMLNDCLVRLCLRGVVMCVQTVEEFYRLQHENQTYDFVCAMEKKSHA